MKKMRDEDDEEDELQLPELKSNIAKMSIDEVKRNGVHK